MCCPLSLCRNETTRGAKGLDIMPRFKKKTEQKDDMRKECNVEDKMLMNSSRCKAVRQGKLQTETKDHYKSSTLHVVPSHSNDKGNILR
jgi:hypothetical protein